MVRLGKVPLGRALSKLGLMSRSQTLELIKAGKVSVNGKVMRDPFIQVIPEMDVIRVSGKRAMKQVPVMVMLHKPKGYVTTRRDEKGRKTVYDLLPDTLQHLHPVGRLDMATTGLLLLTNDTQLSDFLTDPKNGVLRIYIVTVVGCLDERDCDNLRQGIIDDNERLQVFDIDILKVSQRETHLKVKLKEGKNREIRRMMEALGTEVTRLKRISYGSYHLGELPLGEHELVPVTDILMDKR